MEIRPATLSDLPAIRALLTAAGLPVDGVAEQIGGFVVAATDDQVVGCAGLEVLGTCGLLRSVAVWPDRRGRGVGRAMVTHLIERARASGLTGLYLLTTTATDYFARLGFHPLGRDQVPPEIRKSGQFAAGCCVTAQAMGRTLSPKEAP